MKKGVGNIVAIGYKMINAGILIGILVPCFADSLGIEAVRPGHVACCVIVIAGLILLQLLHRKIRIYTVVVFIFGGLLILNTIALGENSNLWNGYLKWLFSVDGWEERYVVYYEFFQMMLLAVVCYGIQILTEKYPLLKRISAFGVGGCLGIWMCCRQDVSHIGVAFAFLYIITAIVEWVRDSQRNTEKRNVYQAYTFWLAPFFILYFVMLCFMPVSKEPYDWQWAKDVYVKGKENLAVFVENIGNGEQEDFDTAASGFSEDGRLLAGLWDNNEPVMKITGDSGFETNIFLTGRVFDRFDGRSWENTNESSVQDGMFDTMETLYALEQYAGKEKGHYIRETRLNIKYQYFHTGYLFAPLKTSFINAKNKISYAPRGNDLIFDSKQGYGAEYDLKFYQLYMGDTDFYQFLQTQTQEDRNTWEIVTKRFNLEPHDYSMEALWDYRQRMKNQYLPKTTVSRDVELWLEDITKDADTSIDKLKCIERKLQNFGYTLNPGKLPDDIRSEEAFLDYFLLDSREGYCSYFATAFVLLARAEGIPARYVQGFCAPVGTNGEIMVYSNMAHAWPEVYLEGKGWIPFEPTPGYGETRNMSWDVPDYNVTDHASNREVLTDDSAKEAETSEVLTSVETREEKPGNGRKLFLRVMFYLLAVTLSSGVLIVAADRIRESRHDKKRSPEEKFRLEVMRNLQILSVLGCVRKEGETFHELRQRAEMMMKEEAYCPIEFIEEYEKVLYGGRKVTGEELEGAKREQKALLDMVKAAKGRKYLFYKIRIYMTIYHGNDRSGTVRTKNESAGRKFGNQEKVDKSEKYNKIRRV